MAALTFFNPVKSALLKTEWVTGLGRRLSLKREKSSLSAMKNRTVRMVSKRANPRALRLAAWNRPLMAMDQAEREYLS